MKLLATAFEWMKNNQVGEIHLKENDSFWDRGQKITLEIPTNN